MLQILWSLFRYKLLAPLACGVISTIVIFGLCFISLGFAFFYPNCAPNECVPERVFKLEQLNLPERFFPMGAQVNELHPMNGKEGAEEAVITANYWDGMSGLAIYQVYRFATVEGASKKLDSTKQGFFFHKREKPLVPIPELTFISSNADEFYIGCGMVSFTYRCGMVAQYQEHVLFFNAIIDGKMTVQDFEEIVLYIDETMKIFLQAEIESP